MRHPLPSLDDLRALEAVARTGSVRAAAQSLAVTHGAVSRRISKLARDIDVRLVEPDGRGIKLTPAGEQLSTVAAAAFSHLTRVLSEIKTRPKHQAIVLSCERSLAMRWLIPRLSGFQDAHPEIALHLSVGGGTLDFGTDDADLAVRRLDFPIDPRWRLDLLMKEEVGPVMQPGAVESFRAGGYLALGTKTRTDAWRDWLERNPEAPRPREIRYLDHHFLMAESAASGLGVAICPRVLAMDDVERGRLIAPLGFTADGSDYGLIHPREAMDTATIGVVKEWLLEAARSSRSV